MVGSSYQVTVPKLLKKLKYSDEQKPYSGIDQTLWNPHRLTEEEVNEYLATVKKINSEKAEGIAAIPLSAHTRDDEQALLTLLQSNYDIEKSVQEMQSKPPRNCTATATCWTENECRRFESGLRMYGKDFFKMHVNKLKTRSVGEIVQYYYLWKKTERHDLFMNEIKSEKIKYLLNPGSTFSLEDRDWYL